MMSGSTFGCRVVAISVMMLVLSVWGFPAQAMQCEEWTGVAAGDRGQTLGTLVRDLLDDPKYAQWTSVNKGRIEECLRQHARAIEIDFDDVCSKGHQASVDALHEILVREARSCAQLVR